MAIPCGVCSSSEMEISNVKVNETEMKEIQNEESDKKKSKTDIINKLTGVDDVAVAPSDSETEFPKGKMVVGIDLLLSMILEAMPDSDLLRNIRLVNFRWYSVATKILQDRYLNSFIFSYDKDKSSFMIEGNDEPNAQTLQSFTALLSNSLTTDFPVAEFLFSDGFLLAPDLQQFLNLHGSRVLKLSLDISSDEHQIIGEKYSQLASFTKLLTEQVPNLRQLSLNFYPDQWKGIVYSKRLDTFFVFKQPKMFSEIEIQRQLLPKLRVFDLTHTTMPPEQLVELLQASINLRSLELSQLNLPLVNYLIQSDRLSLLQKCIFYCTPLNLEAYEKLVDSKWTLKEIEVNLKTTYSEVENPLYYRMARCLERILSTSSESLEKVTWFTSGHLPSLFIPPLKNVKDIKLTDFSHYFDHQFDDGDWNWNTPPSVSLFPPGSPISFSSIFPNLVDVRLFHGYRFEDRLMIPNDVFMEPLFTVQTLSIAFMNNYSEEIISKLAHLFPNTNKGRFCGIDDFPSVAKSIWMFVKLKSLILEINAFSCHNQNPALDLAFTGLSRGTVRMLRVMSEDEIEQHLDKNLLRENPSIADLKDLVSLAIRLVDCQKEKLEKFGETLLMTQLSLDYAFWLLPKLEVCIDIHTEGRLGNYNIIKNSLREIGQNGHYQNYGLHQIIVLGNQEPKRRKRELKTV